MVLFRCSLLWWSCMAELMCLSSPPLIFWCYHESSPQLLAVLSAQQIQRVLNSIKIPAFVETGAETKQAFIAVLEYLLRHGVPVHLLNTGMLPDSVDGPVAIVLANYEPLYVYIHLHV